MQPLLRPRRVLCQSSSRGQGQRMKVFIPIYRTRRPDWLLSVFRFSKQKPWRQRRRRSYLRTLLASCVAPAVVGIRQAGATHEGFWSSPQEPKGNLTAIQSWEKELYAFRVNRLTPNALGKFAALPNYDAAT